MSAKTTSERQVAYRQGKKRLDVFLSEEDYNKINELCSLRKVTKAKLISQIINHINMKNDCQMHKEQKKDHVKNSPSIKSRGIARPA